MKVLVSIQQDLFGGPHNQWLRMAPELAERGIEVHFLLPGEGPGAAERIAAEGVAVSFLPTPRLTLRGKLWGGVSQLPAVARSARSVAEIAHSVGADVVVACGIANLPAAFGARAARLPLVWQLLSVFSPLYVRTGLGALVVALADSIMTVGTGCRDAHPPLRLARSKVVEFLPPVDLREFSPRPPQTQEANGPPVVGTVGNLNPHKGHDILWESCRTLWADGLDFSLRICGQPSPSYQEWYDEGFRRWTDSLAPGALKRITYMKEQGSVAPFLRDLDVFVLPSRSEGVPTTLLEAMATGLPAIAFEVGGVPEVITHGEDGLIAGRPDAHDLARGLHRLLTDEDLRADLGGAARLRAERCFGVRQCTDRHVIALERAAAARGRRVEIDREEDR